MRRERGIAVVGDCDDWLWWSTTATGLMDRRVAVVLTAFAKKDQSLSKKDVERAESRVRTGHHIAWPQ